MTITMTVCGGEGCVCVRVCLCVWHVLCQQVCSQQEPLSGWYVVRNEVDRKSRGSVRLKFTWAEASNKSNDLGSGNSPIFSLHNRISPP
jgi:hypothetical protein